MPTEDIPLSDQSRICLALETLGYQNISFPLPVLRRLYPMYRNFGFNITVTIVSRETDWVVIYVEPGDQRHHHYGLALDYGSTTIIMQLVDLNSGTIMVEETAVNGQTAYGANILTRTTYSLEDPTYVEDLHPAMVGNFEYLLLRDHRFS